MSLLLIAGLSVGCGGPTAKAKEITFDQLFADPGKYNESKVILEGFYFHGFEVIVLSEQLEYSGYAEGHLVPKGRILWVEGGIPKEIYDKLNQQQMMGPTERYGRIRIGGTFEYGAIYGHLGAYDSQVTPTEVELLPRTLPEAEGELSKAEGFAVYLLARDIPVSDMPAISHLELADRPLFSLADIVSYSRTTHGIELNPKAIEKLLNLEVPVNGKVFVVCVDGQPIYWGTFWVPYSSMSFDGVIISKPLSPEQVTVKLELGYPSGSHFSGKDPRSDPIIMQSLEEAGKLR
ncbi:hypothetical protein ACFLYR_08975 [Chloroflexota bacterium]